MPLRMATLYAVNTTITSETIPDGGARETLAAAV
jgi:hypothetical protein